MLRAAIQFDHCVKNVTDTWLATSGYAFTRYAQEPSNGKGFQVNNRGAITAPPGTSTTDTYATILFTGLMTNPTSFTLAYRVTIEAVPLLPAHTMVSVDQNFNGTGSADGGLIVSDFSPNIAVGDTAYIEDVFDTVAGTVSVYVNNVFVRSKALSATLKTAFAAGNFGVFFRLSPSNYAGGCSFRDIMLYDNVTGDTFNGRIGPRRLVPLCLDSAVGSAWAPLTGIYTTTLLDTLNWVLPSSGAAVQSTNTGALAVSLATFLPPNHTIDALVLGMGGQAGDSTGITVNTTLTTNGSTSTAKATAMPTAYTYNLPLGTFPTSPDGAAWTAASVDATTLTFTPVTAGKIMRLRNVQAYAITKPPIQPTFSLTPLASFLAQLNKQYGTGFKSNGVVFESVQTITGDATYNSSVSVRALRPSGFKNAVTLKFKRFPINLAFINKVDLTLPGSGMGSTIWTSLAAINSKFGLSLTTLDVADATITGLVGFNLTVLSTSSLFVPGSVFRIGRDILYAYDASAIKTNLEALGTGGWWKPNDPSTTAAAVINWLNANTDRTNWSMNDSKVDGGIGGCNWFRFVLPSTSVPEANSTKYTRCVCIEPTVGSWFQNRMILHYNP
jgi:hypothetical protein